ncbi:hypothetical protein ACFWY9_16145 [Amycolatopsis sp. NPDC059027]|uniref:hypothetical protein n=1 Tax=unclassified Amycolatopsis TaxID=2618356 RepID=UPI003672D3B3
MTPLPAANIHVKAIQAFGPSDAWAAGTHWVRLVPPWVTEQVVLRWDGRTWQTIDLGRAGDVVALAGTSSDNLWAVASETTGAAVHHWNGSTWTTTPPPADPDGRISLGTAAAAGDTIWVAGNIQHPPSIQAALLRWTGTAWTREQLPVPGESSWLTSMSARAPDDVWAVGRTRPTADAKYEAYVLHFDGNRWSRIPTPSQAHDVLTNTVKAVSANEVWVAGAIGDNNGPGSERPFQAFAMRWNGQDWTGTPTPPTPNAAYLADLATDGSTRWAGGATRTSILKFTGQDWVDGPPPMPGHPKVLALADIPGDGLWAIGDGHDAVPGTPWTMSFIARLTPTPPRRVPASLKHARTVRSACAGPC